MRSQIVCLAGIFAVIIPGWFITALSVRNHGIAGGAWSFLFTTTLLAAVFWVVAAWHIKWRWPDQAAK